MEIFKRYANNPILEPTTLEWESRAVFNAGAIRFQDKIVLIYRARGNDMRSRFGIAWSRDGYNFSRRDEPLIIPDESNELETKGIEDPRITYLNGWYYITYVAASHYPLPHPNPPWSPDAPWRVRISLIRTKDFDKFERLGVIMPDVDSKDPAIFPEKIDNRYWMFHRVFPNMNLAQSDDLKKMGRHRNCNKTAGRDVGF